MHRFSLNGSKRKGLPSRRFQSYSVLNEPQIHLWRKKREEILDQMEKIVHDEIVRTELSLLAVTRDSRLGFQFEQDYVYTPYSLKEKLGVLEETLNKYLPAARKKKSQ